VIRGSFVPEAEVAYRFLKSQFSYYDKERIIFHGTIAGREYAGAGDIEFAIAAHGTYG
jgi:hypothetical protein